jgi:predicted PurR-regulated permease PerM
VDENCSGICYRCKQVFEHLFIRPVLSLLIDIGVPCPDRVPSPQPITTESSSSTPLLAVITAVIVIAGLYLGKDLLIPFAFALLLSFLLSSPVTWLERMHLGRAVSVVLVLVTTFLLAGALIWLGLQQLSGMVETFPQYRDHILRKIQAVRNPAGAGMARSIQSLNQLMNALTARQTPADLREQTAVANQGPRRHEAQPVPVEVIKPETGLFSSLSFVSELLIHYVGLLIAAVILTLFMLLNRGHLRNRLFRLLGQGHLVLMTTALDEAAQKVSRYLLTQTLVNLCFGTFLGLGLWGLGVPYAPFWGALAAFLRFIPYVGTILAGGGPLLLSLAVFDGWSRPLRTVALCAAIEAIMSGAVEPWLYATRTGISSLAILISAAFWTLLWGPIGLILATPLTVCLAVLGRNIPHLAFLYVLLGDEPVLTPEVSYYQRLLAMDEEEAAELAETFLKEKTVIELYDEVLIPALGLAEQDRHNNRLEEHRVDFLQRSIRDLLDELTDRATPTLTQSRASNAEILCIPVRDEADELVGMMAAQTLQESERNSRCLSLGKVAEFVKGPSENSPELVILSALPPFAVLPARALCRHLRRSHPHVKIVLGIWNSAAPAEKIRERLGSQCSDTVVTSIQQLNELQQLAPHEGKPSQEVEAESGAMIGMDQGAR